MILPIIQKIDKIFCDEIVDGKESIYSLNQQSHF